MSPDDLAERLTELELRYMELQAHLQDLDGVVRELDARLTLVERAMAGDEEPT